MRTCSLMIRYDQYVIGNEINIQNIWRGPTAVAQTVLKLEHKFNFLHIHIDIQVHMLNVVVLGKVK